MSVSDASATSASTRIGDGVVDIDALGRRAELARVRVRARGDLNGRPRGVDALVDDDGVLPAELELT
jgi:hypothetical protein